jgi:hypothetical protein
MSEELRNSMYKATAESSLLKRVATADEIASGGRQALPFVTLNADDDEQRTSLR